ncbi:major facilitator superfamily domain-containing protein [Elsinoe ampelina]|uniref:Major facilitator superfamily domain-containing protein n=1 Tax=Elsinoe ampelina TaxID=302913 RepID=A0A6A6GBC1_9PEZI|nr:major facilitator superfamily domain-containing protein [Elsinoe ampelina]
MEKDLESQCKTKIPHIKLILDQGVLTPEIESHHYKGAGTEDDPFIVSWIPDDPRNPQNWSGARKWTITAIVAVATLAVAFVSSAYSGGARQIIQQFEISQEVSVLGVSLFVLGFAIGPLLWAPLSEMFGRQVLFFTTYAGLTAFNAGAAGSQNIESLLIQRFFAGAIGSSPLTNAGGVLADMFSANERGVAMSLFAAAPFMGPVIGPIVGGFVGQTVGWRWVQGVMAIFTGVLWLVGGMTVPETYPPVLLRKRAAALSRKTGQIYKSESDAQQGPVSLGHVFGTALSRPWILLFKEPIVLLLTIYMAIIYGVLYMLFSAFPIVYQQQRGWSQGIGGLAFLGVAVGMVFAVAYSIWDNKRYVRINHAHNGFAPPEARLPPTMIGAISVVIGLFWFAWTNSPSVHYMASISAGVPFGFGMVLVFLSIMNYLIDSYVIFAASVLAANSVLRSLFGAAFPLFTTQMYSALGIHWAASIPAFLALACVPFPFLFYKYGASIREKCTYAAQAMEFMKRLQQQKDQGDSSEDIDEKEQEARDMSYDDEEALEPRFEDIRTGNEARQPDGAKLVKTKSYEGNPYDIDRVATRESFQTRASRTASREGSIKGRK